MRLINEIPLETPFGFRTIELHEGDLTRLDAPVGAIVASAFGGGYVPIPGTLFRSLRDNLGIDVEALLHDAEYDFRDSLGIWISRPLVGQPFGRLLCVELIGGAQPLPEALDNLFVGLAVLEAKGVPIQSIAMPLLGAGNQGIPPDRILQGLLPAARRAINRLESLDRLLFVERDQTRAAAVSQALDLSLRRSTVRLRRSDALSPVRQELLTSVQRHQYLLPPAHATLAGELRRILEAAAPSAIEVGIVGRRLVEFVANEIHGGRPGVDLLQKIETLRAFGVAPWLQSYMHVLRVVGNEQAHQKGQDRRRPPFVEAEDLTVCVFCMLRVWEFWVAWRGEPLETAE